MANYATKRMEVFNQVRDQIQPVNAFSFEGVIFEGYYIDAINTYSDTNESRPFYIWLHDTYTILNPSKNIRR